MSTASCAGFESMLTLRLMPQALEEYSFSTEHALLVTYGDSVTNGNGQEKKKSHFAKCSFRMRLSPPLFFNEKPVATTENEIVSDIKKNSSLHYL